MLDYLANNIATIILSLVILAVIVLIIRRLVKEKRAGRTVCGCSASGVCSSCSHCSAAKEGCASCCSFLEDVKIQKP